MYFYPELFNVLYLKRKVRGVISQLEVVLEDPMDNLQIYHHLERHYPGWKLQAAGYSTILNDKGEPSC